jgi:hypothetical protein
MIVPVVGTAWAQGFPNAKLVEAAKKEGEVVYYATMTR